MSKITPNRPSGILKKSTGSVGIRKKCSVESLDSDKNVNLNTKEDVEAGQCSPLEDFVVYDDEEMSENETTFDTSQYSAEEQDEVEIIEDQTLNDSSREVPCSSQTTQKVRLKVFSMKNANCENSLTLNNKRKQPITPKPPRGFVVKRRKRDSFQPKRPKANEKFPEVPVPSNLNQYGDCMKTRLGRSHYGFTLSEPRGQFFQGVLKGASGQTLAAMFGDVDLISKFERVPVDEIGHYVIDTTFKLNPNSTEGVNQLFTISLLHQNVVIPLWYAITSCSSSELYKRILIEFRQHVLDWPFSSVLVDNDPALCKALQAVFPGVDFYGSWFHYCYSIWKEVNIHNLTEHCKKEDSAMLVAVKCLMVVPFMPPSTLNNTSPVDMADGFEYVQDFAKENNLPKEFDKVLDYVCEFWFNKVKPENFTLFGKHSSALNHVEVQHLLLRSYMIPNGNVWTLTRAFLNVAKLTHTDFNRYLNGIKPVAKTSQKTWKKFNLPIRQNMRKLMSGTLDVKTYLEKSTVYLEEMLDIFLHPLYPTKTLQKTNYIHTEGWAVRIYSD